MCGDGDGNFLHQSLNPSLALAATMAPSPSPSPSVPLPTTLTEFREEAYWDGFFKASKGRPFEWYGSWANLPLLFHQTLGLPPDQNPPLEILVPGCGNSSLSALMYDAGFKKITNVDFNKRVVTEMLRENVRARPLMRWLVMDITKMQFGESSFDVVLDKGSLDALTGEPEEPPEAATALLSEVKRVLRHGGKYVCITLAQKHVTELLLMNFRKGWEVCVHQVQDESSDTSSFLQPLLIVATKSNLPDVSLVKSSLQSLNPAAPNLEQMECLVSVIEAENRLRSGGDLYNDPHKETVQEADYIPNFRYDQLHPGKLRSVTLGGHYTAIILDAKPQSGPHTYPAAVFLVPRGRAHEWLFSTDEGQWQIIESAQAGRLIMVFLDTQQYPGSLSAVQDELSPLVKQFLPLDCRVASNIPYMTTDDGVHRRSILDEITSPITGTIKVEDVVLENGEASGNAETSPKFRFYRRLVFDRNPNLIQSDASLVPYTAPIEVETPKAGEQAVRRAKKRGHAKRFSQNIKQDVKEEYRVDHSQLASNYHAGMIAGLTLISDNLEQWVSTEEPTRVMVVGLGAGLLPMFIHNHLPVHHIQVIELDGVMGGLAKLHFGFLENDRMHLRIGDGIEAVHTIARASRGSCDHSPGTSSSDSNNNDPDSRVARHNDEVKFGKAMSDLSDNLSGVRVNGGTASTKDDRLHALFIDADAGDPSLEMSCPPQGFLEVSFLRAARAALVDGGILAINVVSRATGPHRTAISNLQEVFEEVYELKIDEDVNRVLFALPQKSRVGLQESPNGLKPAVSTLKRVAVKYASWHNGPSLDKFLESDTLQLVPRD